MDVLLRGMSDCGPFLCLKSSLADTNFRVKVEKVLEKAIEKKRKTSKAPGFVSARL